MQRRQDQVGNHAKNADQDHGRKDLGHHQVPLSFYDVITDSRAGANYFRDNKIGPRPSDADAVAIEDLWQGCWPKNPEDQVSARGAQHRGCLIVVYPHGCSGILDHEDQLEESSQEDDNHLLQITATKPEDANRDERRHRHVADKPHDGLEDLAGASYTP